MGNHGCIRHFRNTHLSFGAYPLFLPYNMEKFGCIRYFSHIYPLFQASPPLMTCNSACACCGIWLIYSLGAPRSIWAKFASATLRRFYTEISWLWSESGSGLEILITSAPEPVPPLFLLQTKKYMENHGRIYHFRNTHLSFRAYPLFLPYNMENFGCIRYFSHIYPSFQASPPLMPCNSDRCTKIWGQGKIEY